jgi:hypothetical protein
LRTRLDFDTFGADARDIAGSCRAIPEQAVDRETRWAALEIGSGRMFSDRTRLLGAIDRAIGETDEVDAIAYAADIARNLDSSYPRSGLTPFEIADEIVRRAMAGSSLRPLTAGRGRHRSAFGRP